ncbi:MBL fold metallo-hydrolase [Thermoanaerobacterium sp. RBIITD]|uniref:MBL fold metallo-hydrolase n=1 Tax=Thermoanaerobacterium sp. RBIITD TaxID=1550240 RepID=UPI000BB96DC5|nr:MBL fold metallo-hydrolase [Thermoanaerobacterium sp. RBIITD]SNX55222.1 Ribonuclease BN, tRNA processing enzyme [Thermoanaerobacterium sp. RBIITD]
MKLTILGSHGPYPGKDGACSGYLLENNRMNILIDCGNGVLSRYQRYYDLRDLKYIILTHFHSDHVSDMMVLRYAVDIRMRKGDIKEPINIYCPNEPLKVLDDLNFNGVFKLNIVDEKTKLKIDNLLISFEKMEHPVLTYAVKFNDGKKTFAFSGDTMENDRIIPFIKSCDVFLCDGNLLGDEKGPHLTARRAAEISKAADCKKLIITHLWPQHTTDEYFNEASKVIQDVIIAKDFEVYDI